MSNVGASWRVVVELPANGADLLFGAAEWVANLGCMGATHAHPDFVSDSRPKSPR